MTVEESIVAVLHTVCPRVAPDFMATTVDRPYVIFTQIGGDSITFLEKALPSKENGQFQIDVWADTRAQAKATIKAIESAMVAATAFDASSIAAPSSDADPDMKRYCSRQDFNIWSNR